MTSRRFVPGRRTFLVGSAALAGGVAFGTWTLTRPTGNPLRAAAGPGDAALTPFVMVGEDGVTLITPRADVGQGAHSLQAHLIAEELDVDPHTVRLDSGLPHAAYWNSALADTAAPVAPFRHGWTADAVRGLLGGYFRVVGLQITGGSTTTPDMYVRLRVAGACAREVLKAAAAAEHGIPAGDLVTRDGAVRLPDGREIPYPALAATAATLPIPGEVALRPPQSWRFLGKAHRRTDSLAKASGTQRYGIDVHLDDMLFATVRTHPAVGGTMRRFDAGRALAMRGVRDVVPITGGVGVIADNTWRAFQAADAVEIEFDDDVPWPATTERMWQVMAAAIAPRWRDSRLRDDGRVDRVHAEAGDGLLSAEYRTPCLAHAPLEPMNATARVRRERVDIWTGTQVPAFLRDHAAALTGVPAERVFVHNQASGGSFGARLDDTYALQAVEIARAVEGTPVKMTCRREHDMTHEYPRPPHLARARGTVRDGRVHSLDMDCASPSVAASWFGRLGQRVAGPDPMIVAGAFDQPYAIPHYRVTGYAAQGLMPVGSWRSPGACSNGFFHECFLDELIHAAGADPLAERLRLCHHAPARSVLEAVAAMAQWDGPRPGPGRGRGVAFVYAHGVPVAEIVDVTRLDDGAIRIDHLYAAADVGRVLDPVNAEAQLSGAALFGLGHALNCEITYENHSPRQTNFHLYAGLRLGQTPAVTVRLLEGESSIRGLGEPGLPPAAPALANAIFAATGKRIRELPLNRHVRFA